MSTANTIRVTKAQKLEAIKGFLPEDCKKVFHGNDSKAAYTFDYDEAVAFIDKELGLLAKKNSGDKKMTADQKANEGYKEDIMEYLRSLPEFIETEDGKTVPHPGATCTDVLKNVPSLADFQVQKAAALLRQLKDATLVIPSKGKKGQTYFKVA